MPKRMALPPIGIAILLGALHAAAAAGEEPSDNIRRYRLKLVPQETPQPWEDRRIGVVDFYHGGLGQDDGSDVVVWGRNGRVPHRVLQAGPGDFWRIAFAYDDPSAMAVDFGLAAGAKPPKTTAFPADWQPTAGLLLTTYALPSQYSADSWEEMERLLRTARCQPALGCDFVEQVYHGYHPFGEASAFLSCYEGWLGIPADGDYTFATSSDDASFLFVDDKCIAAWPGQHPAVADSRHRGRIHLAKGVRRFSYYHANFGGETIACAAWQGPGWDQIVPIAKESFAPVAKFQPGPADKNSPPLMRISRLGEAWCEGQCLMRYGCEIAGEKAAVIQWDFGDGCRAEGCQGEHIYLTPGLRQIKADGKAANRVLIAPDPSLAIARKYEEVGGYLQEIARYPFAQLSTADLAAAVKVLSSENNHCAAAVAAGRALLAREISAELRCETAMLVGERLRRHMHDPAQAISVYRAALDAIRQADGERQQRRLIAYLMREIGDTFFYYLHDLDAALNEYDKVVGRYADALEDNIVRLTKIKIGDIHRERGDAAKARAIYEDAARLLLYRRNLEQETVRKGALYKAVDDYLRRRDTAAAQEWLEILEWEYPMEKLDGASSLYRSRIAAKSGNMVEAEKQLRIFLRAAPRSAYAAEGMYELAQILNQQGKQEETRDILKRLRQDYPDSPYALSAADKK